MRHYLPFFFCFILFLTNGRADNPPFIGPAFVEAGDDVILCESGQVQLNGSIQGDYCSFEWTPFFGVSDPNILDPLANANIGSTTYYLSAYGFDPAAPNLVFNGDFESGNTGFSTAYTYQPNGDLNEENYRIANFGDEGRPEWDPCTDLSGNGNMMLVNAATNGNIPVWCQTVNVQPNTSYVLSVWLVTLFPASPAELQFSVNGVNAGDVFNANPSTCIWEQNCVFWDSDGSTTAEFCINNINTESFGNDFGIDGISFSEACSVTDSLTITVENVFAITNPLEIIPCNNGGVGVTLDATGSSTGPDVTYEWTTANGNIVSGANTLMPLVNAPGIYELVVTVMGSDGPCEATASVEVIDDVPPLAFATTGNDINCINTTGTILGSGSTVGPNIVYQWSTPDGFIVSGENDIIAEVGAQGTYTLLVTDQSNGCFAEASTFVAADLDLPTAVADPDGNLDCNNTIVIIDGSGSSGGSNLTFEWSTTNGNIISGTTGDSIEVDAPGDYELTVINGDNLCSETISVTVTSDNDPPIVDIEMPGSIDCSTTNFNLDASGSSGSGNLSFVWTTVDGNIVSGDSTATPVIDQTGTYDLVISDDANGCTSAGSVLVDGDLAPPDILIAIPALLTCNEDEIALDASGSQPGVIFSWTTPDGNIVSGGNTAQPTVDQNGNYILVITDPDNGCTSTDSVEVDSDQTLPVADAGAVVNLDCNTTATNLDGTNSSSGPGITYLWTTTNGNILSGETTLTPEINSGGTYVLTVTNSATGCESTDEVVIPQNNDLPTAVASVPNGLNCNNLTLIIDGTGSSSGTGYSILWTTTDGNIISGETTLMPEVDEGGTYVLTITNLTSTCTATDEVVVTANFTTPQADAGAMNTLTCVNDTLQLDGSGSAFSNNATILWSTTNGEFTEGENTLMPTITAPGTYVLTITNTESGCTDEAFVEIDENTEQPTADAGAPMELTCTTTAVPLNGSGSSQIGNLTYTWTTQNGNIVSGENGLMPLVDEEGDYLLTVIDNDNGCESTSIVEVTLNGDFPVADAGPTAELTCAITQTVLQGTGDIGPTFIYNWTTIDGEIVSGDSSLTPEIGASGTYTLTLTNTDNGCATTDEVFVSENTTPPSADAGPTDELSCTQTQLSLTGTGNAPGNDISYAWNTSNGNIISGENTPSPLVNAAGTYWLVITDNLNGCADSSSVVITQDANVPVADAGSSALLTCNVTTLFLDGSGSSMNPDIVYEWTTTDGNILNGESTLAPEVDAPGTYLLTVTDVVNDCEAVSSVLIDENIAPPPVNAGPDGLLTCNDPQVTLDGSASVSGPDFSYLWTTIDGNILSGNDQPLPLVDAIGTYQLLVTNTLTGCTNTATVDVDEDVTPPTVLIENPDVITCEFLEIELDASNSSIGSFIYTWSTTNGNIISGATTTNPTVDLEGEYELLVTNTLNGCTAISTIMVSEDKELPDAEAGPAMEINCYNPTLELDGSGSSTGIGFQYFWTTADGNILSGETTLAPEINGPGTYTLTVLDDSNGCLSTSEVAITDDTADPVVGFLPPNDLTCTETSVTIDAASSSSGLNFQYEWTTQNGNIVNGQNTLLLTVDKSGDYILTILNIDNGCEDSVSVTVNEDIDLPAVDAGPTVELHCNLPEASLAGSTDLAIGQYTAIWTTNNGQLVAGQNSLAPLVNAPGDYQLTVTDLTNGCSETDEVVVSENILVDFEFVQQDPSCLSSTGLVEFVGVQGGEAPFNYSIDNGQSFSSVATYPLPAGMYDLVVQDANGCELSDVAFLAEPPEILLFLEAQAELQLGESYQLSLQASIPDDEIETVEWTPAEFLSCSDCMQPFASPIQQTSFNVTVTSKDGCSETATTLLLVRKDVNIYVPNAFSPNGDGTNDQLLIYTGGNGISQINSFKVFSRWGESVFQYFDFQPNDPAYGWDGTHKEEVLNPGVFVWFADVELIDGTTKLLKGEVHLIR
ncbi:MAG: gliding motility-associated C-terminal domain-containing protein [Bacteroidota bacterium]